jgi:hypothetical protein
MSESVIVQVLRWLRAGYPEGVPPKDFTPLLALLRRNLSEDDFDAVIDEIERHDPELVRVSHIRAAIARVSDAAPDDAELRQVASRLAAAGWPLSSGANRLVQGEPPEGVSPIDGVPSGTGMVGKALRWLQQGYPTGVPAADTVPLVHLLRVRLSEADVFAVAEAIVAKTEKGTSLTPQQIEARATEALGGRPSEEDLDRVRARLAASDWSVA